MVRLQPGVVRDAIVSCLAGTEATVAEITARVAAKIPNVPTSSVRSYLRLNTGKTFEQVERGRYRLVGDAVVEHPTPALPIAPAVVQGQASLYQADCVAWLRAQPPNSVHAVVTDPPYSVVEYSDKELEKLRKGRGGVWRIPPSFDGHQRSPVPRFTTLTPSDLEAITDFFRVWAVALAPVLVPGAHVFIACNPLLSYLVSYAVASSGLERRGEVARLVMTMRGGDRPKNAHDEFTDVSVMPRSMWEPWLLFRKPMEGRAQDNLRKWRTGGLRRVSAEQPFGDVIKSSPTRPAERALAPHPSLKPQAFIRGIVRASLPLGEGIVLDPFAGSGSTLAAAEAVGYRSVGVELDAEYVRMAATAIPRLAALKVAQEDL